MKTDLQQAVTILKKGGIGIFPTDTAFGLGCVVSNKEAVKRLFAIKKRLPNQAVPILIDSPVMARIYWKDIPSSIEEKLIRPYWPGALTIVYDCKEEAVPPLARGMGHTVGLRIPASDVARTLLQGVGEGIVGTSANFNGKPTVYNSDDLDTELVSLVDFVISGMCPRKRASTVIDCSQTPWKVVREGAVQVTV